MTPATLPKSPVENWEQVRDEWVAAVEKLIQDAEAWSKKQDWATRRDPKTLKEKGQGEYIVPRLLIHTIDGRLLLDPIARDVMGATGLVELCVMPSYDSIKIVRFEDGWKMLPEKGDGEFTPLTEETFLATVLRLLKTL
jgi:hypothetical protein